MLIRQKHTEFTVEVYGIYWAVYQGTLQRFHLVIPESGYPGFVAVPESECELVDSSISEFVLIKDIGGRDSLVHSILHKEEGLLDKIIDHDSDAVDHFLKLVLAS